MDRAGEHLERVEIIGKVVEEPEVVDGDCWVRIETYDGWYHVILKQGKRWLKPGTMIKVGGILRDDTLLAYSCEQYQGEV